jgi:hypothetical protein
VFLAKPPLPPPSAGAGFASQDLFLHGFFSAAVKLPADYAAGVVVAFYVRSPFPLLTIYLETADNQ